jgi:POT family proton-dependent oligopeptide transporter
MTDKSGQIRPDTRGVRHAAEGELRLLPAARGPIPDEGALRELAPGRAEEAVAVTMRQPPGLFLLFIVEMWERFSYYGMRALLVLYLISLTTGPNPGRGWLEDQANLLYGWYTGLAYLLPLLGGYLADKLLGTHRSMLIGGTIIALGHIVLAASGLGTLAESHLGMSLFVGGLALIIIGTGYFKPCVSVMVGQLYGPHDPRRDGGFTIFYMGINLGAFICAFICGTLGEQVGWHWGFGSAAVGMLAGLFVYLLGRPRYLRGIGEPPPGRPNYLPVLFPVSVLLAAVVMAVYHIGGFGWLDTEVRSLLSRRPVAVGLSVGGPVLLLGWLVWFISIQKEGDKGPTATIFLFLLFNAFFWIAFEQAGSTLNVFAKNSTNRNLFGWEVPATWFQSVNPLLILVLAPLFAAVWSGLGRRGLDPSQAVKIGLGLLFLGGGYVFMVLAARVNAEGALVSMFWLLATYTFHTLGELCLSPTGLSFVTKTAPFRYVSLLMGFWFISSFLANLGGGIIASYVKQVETGELELFWYRWFRLGGRADFFLLFVISSVSAGLVILLLTPLTRRLLHGRE